MMKILSARKFYEPVLNYNYLWFNTVLKDIFKINRKKIFMINFFNLVSLVKSYEMAWSLMAFYLEF
jgi:hypothetical protein